MTKPESTSLANDPGLKSLQKNVDILTTPLTPPITQEDLDTYVASIFPRSKRGSIFGTKMTGWELKRLARSKLYGSYVVNIPQMVGYGLYMAHVSWLGDIGFSLSHQLSRGEYYKLERKSLKYERRFQKDPIIEASIAEDPSHYFDYSTPHIPRRLNTLIGEVTDGKISHGEALAKLRGARTSLYKSGVGELLAMHAKIGRLSDASEYIARLGDNIAGGDRDAKGLRKIPLLPVPKDKVLATLSEFPYPENINLPIFSFGRRAIRLDEELARLEADVVVHEYNAQNQRLDKPVGMNAVLHDMGGRIRAYTEPLRRDARLRR